MRDSELNNRKHILNSMFVYSSLQYTFQILHDSCFHHICRYMDVVTCSCQQSFGERTFECTKQTLCFMAKCATTLVLQEN